MEKSFTVRWCLANTAVIEGGNKNEFWSILYWSLA